MSKWMLNAARIFVTFILIDISLIFFRSPNLETALTFLSKMGFHGSIFTGTASIFVYSIIGIVVISIYDIGLEFFNKNIFKLKSHYFVLRSLPYALLVIVILVIGVFDGGQFIYFQF